MRGSPPGEMTGAWDGKFCPAPGAAAPGYTPKATCHLHKSVACCHQRPPRVPGQLPHLSDALIGLGPPGVQLAGQPRPVVQRQVHAPGLQFEAAMRGHRRHADGAAQVFQAPVAGQVEQDRLRPRRERGQQRRDAAPVPALARQATQQPRAPRNRGSPAAKRWPPISRGTAVCASTGALRIKSTPFGFARVAPAGPPGLTMGMNTSRRASSWWCGLLSRRSRVSRLARCAITTSG